MFLIDPLQFIVDDERATAVKLLNTYFATYTGSRFETTPDREQPDEITERDLLAVSMLGVNVPPNATVWILENGRGEIRRLLQAIPRDQTIFDRDADLTRASYAGNSGTICDSTAGQRVRRRAVSVALRPANSWLPNARS